MDANNHLWVYRICPGVRVRAAAARHIKNEYQKESAEKELV